MRRIHKECELAMLCDMETASDEPVIDQSEYRDHLIHCEGCRTTEEVLELCRSSRNDHGALERLDDLATQRLVNRVVSESRKLSNSVHYRHSGPRRMVTYATAAIVLLILVAGTVLIRNPEATIDSVDPEVTGTHKKTAPLHMVTGSRFSLLFGEVFMGDSPVVVSSLVESDTIIKTRAGRAVISLPAGVVVSIEENTAFSVREERNGHVFVDFLNGTAFFAVDPQVSRSGLSVVTNKGAIDVTGTVFTVQSGRMKIDLFLYKGEVFVEGGDGLKRKIHEGESVTLGEPGSRHISPEISIVARENARELLGIGLSDHLRVFLDSPEWGSSTVMNEHEIQNESTKRSKSSSKAGKTRRDSFSDLEILMTKARDHKTRKEWLEAVTTYKTVIERYPEGDDARTSLVSIGQLYLVKIHHPAKALGYFKRYLSANPRGPLAQEALFGQSRACRVLGDNFEERKVLQKIVECFPDGIHIDMVKKRLHELGSE